RRKCWIRYCPPTRRWVCATCHSKKRSVTRPTPRTTTSPAVTSSIKRASACIGPIRPSSASRTISSAHCAGERTEHPAFGSTSSELYDADVAEILCVRQGHRKRRRRFVKWRADRDERPRVEERNHGIFRERHAQGVVAVGDHLTVRVEAI